MASAEESGPHSPFVLDVTPNAQSIHNNTNTIPYVKVYQNKTYLKQDKWTLSTDDKLTLSTTLALGDIIDVEVYSSEVSVLGHYEIPLNLDLNAQNVDITDLTLWAYCTASTKLACGSNRNNSAYGSGALCCKMLPP